MNLFAWFEGHFKTSGQLRRLAARAWLLLALSLVPFLAQAQVSLPNGTYSESIEDLRVKVLGGNVVIERQYVDGRWQLNPRWNTLKFTYDPLDSSVTSIDRNGSVYARQGDGWTFDKRNLIRRQSVSVLPVAPAGTPTPGIPGQDGQTLASVQGYRWLNRTGDWIDYDTEGRIAAYGDKNDVKVWFQYDANGKLKTLLDHLGRIVLTYTWSGDLLTQVQDNPNLISGNTAAARSVKYTYSGTTPTTPAYPLLVKATDTLGNDTSYTYETGKLKTLSDPENRIRTLTYGPTGRINSVKEADGAETGYLYDYDKVKRQFYNRVTGPQTAAGQRIEETWYDSDGRIIRRDLNGKTQSTLTLDTGTRTQVRKDAAGQSTTTQTDEYDNPVKTTYPDGSQTTAVYSAVHGQILEETDELGVKTAYAYDTRGNLTQKTEAAGKPEQRITEYRYDSYGMLASVTRKGGAYTLPNGVAANVPDATTSYTYDLSGNRVTVTNAEGQASQMVYDHLGNALETTDARGNLWKKRYSAKGLVMEDVNPLNHSTLYGYDKVGNKVKMTDAEGNVTRFEYDAMNRLVKTTDALGYIKRQEYDFTGNLIAEIDEAGKPYRRYRYNIDGLLVEEIDGNNNSTGYVYDDIKAIQLKQIVYPTYRREFEYDARNRVSQITDLPSETQRLSAQFAYNAVGKRISQTDPAGRVTRYEYDALRRLSKTTDPAGGQTKFAYDSRNNLLALTDANGNTLYFGYDKNNRKISEVLPLGQTTRYQYDSTGNRTKVTDAKSQVTEHQFDAANREIRLTAMKADGAVERAVEFTVSAVGTLAAYTDGALTVTIGVDALQRKLSESVNFGSFTKTWRYTYHPTGRKASIVGPDGTAMSFAFDDAQQLKEVQIPSGALSIGEYRHTQPARVTLPGGATQRTEYDALLRPLNIKSIDPQQAQLLSRTYTYDISGDITKIQGEDATYEYQYDNLDRLTRASYGIFSSETFGYDAVHNRISDSNVTDTWQYNANNQLIQKGNQASYEYDTNGQTVKKTEGGKVIDYRYNSENRLVEVKENGQPIAQYRYDPLGRRIQKTVYRDQSNQTLTTPKSVYYLYADEGLIAEFDAQGNQTTAYGWQPDGTWGTSPIWIKTARQGQADQEIFYFHNDHLGTPQKVTDASGNIVWSQRQSAFGQTQLEVSLLINNLRFPGQYYDQETGLYYNYFRDYDPSLGRYVQADPAGIKGGVNRYFYSLGNPVRFADPSGLITGQQAAITGAIIGVGGVLGAVTVPTQYTQNGQPLGSGCGDASTDGNIPDAFAGWSFAEPCRKHDRCYGKCGEPKDKCDKNLLSDARGECGGMGWAVKIALYKSCMITAGIFYAAVHYGGQGAYCSAQKAACPECQNIPGC